MNKKEFLQLLTAQMCNHCDAGREDFKLMTLLMPCCRRRRCGASTRLGTVEWRCAT